MWLSDLFDHICYQGNNLFGSEIKCVVGGGDGGGVRGVGVKVVLQWRHKKFDFAHVT